MSNYIVTTDFAAKDALPSGNPGKLAQGTQIDTELDNIATAVATKEDLANKGSANGYAGLDSGAKVPRAQLPSPVAYEDEANTFVTGQILQGAVTLGNSTGGVTVADTSGSLRNKGTANNQTTNVSYLSFQQLGGTENGWVGFGLGTNELRLNNSISGANTNITTAGGGAIQANGTAVSVSGHGHTAAETTSGTFADARIAQSNVTQHQAALAINASQVASDIPSDQTSNFSVASSMAGDFVTVNAAGTVTITVGSNCLGAAGKAAIFIRRGAGAVTFSASGTTIRTKNGLSVTSQHGAAGLIQLTSTEYQLTGDI